ncbi:MAG: NAD(+) synthase [Syntrophomonadaceae bacterium]|nr:NAD(+) synthase [Syntrophomonadaceae bacterium]
MYRKNMYKELVRLKTALIAENLVKWIGDQVSGAGAKGVVFGLSGGIDSAVVAGLAVRAFPHSTLGIIMPCDSLPEDIEHGGLVADKYGLELKIIDLLPIYESFRNILAGPADDSPLASANIKPRLRMVTLYYYAQQLNYLVLGTGNRTEWEIGYFTKYGDGGVDLEPIGGLVKSQVRDLAVYLEVPEVIIHKPPSAGLWEGQTDEDELGISYEELDRFILHGQGSDEARQRFEKLQKTSQHKRHLPPFGAF